jgi:hypothetical protein
MTAIPTPPEPQVRPAWATALGLLGIVIAVTHSIGIVDTLSSMLSRLTTDPIAASQPSLQDSARSMYMWTTCIRLAGCIVLLAGAGLLLKRRRSARRVFIIYLALVWGGFLLGLAASVYAALTVGARNPGFAPSIVPVLYVFLDPYPIFYAIWFLRPTVAKEMATWQ